MPLTLNELYTQTKQQYHYMVDYFYMTSNE